MRFHQEPGNYTQLEIQREIQNLKIFKKLFKIRTYQAR